MLAEAGQHLVRDRKRGFRGDIARRRTGASGREHEMAAHPIDELDQRLLDARLLVGNEPLFHAPAGLQCGGEPVREARNAFVLIDSRGGAVAYRYQTNEKRLRIRIGHGF